MLSVDYVSLAAKLRYVGELCVKIQENINGLIEMTKELDIFWNGDANTSFIGNINDDIAYIEALLIKIRQMIRCANEALNEYQEAEKVINKMIVGMKK